MVFFHNVSKKENLVLYFSFTNKPETLYICIQKVSTSDLGQAIGYLHRKCSCYSSLFRTECGDSTFKKATVETEKSSSVHCFLIFHITIYRLKRRQKFISFHDVIVLITRGHQFENKHPQFLCWDLKFSLR
jgi:hypothetical protein